MVLLDRLDDRDVRDWYAAAADDERPGASGAETPLGAPHGDHASTDASCDVATRYG